MNKIVFTEEFCRPENLVPFTLTRRIQDIRMGILTIREKWELALGLSSYDKKENDYKDGLLSIEVDKSIGKDIVYLIHGNILPDSKLVRMVRKLKQGECISVQGRESIVYCISKKEIEEPHKIKIRKAIEYSGELREIKVPWEIFQMNAWAIEHDFSLLKKERKPIKISATNRVINAKNVFIEKGAYVEHCIVNATGGPVYIGKNAQVMEGAMLRGPLAICENAIVKMGAKLYGATTIGPGCIVGGEIKNSVFFGYSNKAHDGYVGDSVIGEWCNLGAGTSNSNIKNTASTVMVWSPSGSVNVGQKCGMLMGDYSRTAINTSVNTGTVIGVGSNVFGNGLTPKFIPSFSWGSDGVERYGYEKAMLDIGNWKGLKKQILTEGEKVILKHIFDHY